MWVISVLWVAEMEGVLLSVRMLYGFLYGEKKINILLLLKVDSSKLETYFKEVGRYYL
jgi:hypothetical protein